MSIGIVVPAGFLDAVPAPNQRRVENRMSRSPAVPRTRHPSPRKHEAILLAAIEAFADNGFAATSMDSIAAVAGVSKQTVYHHFGNKGALFEAVIGRLSAMISLPLVDGHARDRTPLETLTTLGRHTLEFLLCPQALTFTRLMVAEAPKFDGLTDTILSGMETTIQVLARYLVEETARGRLAIDEPRRATLMFFGMLLSEYRFHGLLGLEIELPQAEMDAHARAVAQAFVKAFTPARAAPSV